MIKTKTNLLASVLTFVIIWLSCKTESNPVAEFLSCHENCTAAALKVKDAYLENPAAVLAAFAWNKDEETEAKYANWLAILQDSFFFNAEGVGLTPIELGEIKEQMVAGANSLTQDNNVGPLALLLIEKIGSLAFLGRDENPVIYTGTYAYERPNDAGAGELKLSRGDGQTVRFSLLVVAGPPAYNQGSMEGMATILGDGTVEIKTTDFGGTCRLAITLQNGQAVIKTLEGDPPTCGFGNSVMADGTYQLVSQDDPFATLVIDPAKLEGTWVSTEDPKSVVQISGGRYLDIYDGEKLFDSAYTFFAVCPAEDCGVENGGMPCIKVTGDDVLCYTVLLADGTNLEISMIGGRGNTLAFKKK